MKNKYSIMILSLTLGILLSASCASTSSVEKERPVAQHSAPVSEAKASPVVYKPPVGKDEHATRVSSAPNRGATDHNGPLALLPLVPEHPGLTTNRHPTLYWYVSKEVTSTMEFILVHDKAIQPLVEVTMDPPIKPGMHHLYLSEFSLALDKEYRWFVSVVPDSAERSKDIIAGGVIKRVQPPAALFSQLQSRAKREHPAVFAEAGLWYDAITTISELIGANPADKTLRLLRAALLEQVGLPAAADADRTAVLLGQR